MTENVDSKNNALPQAEDENETEACTDTAPETQDEIFVPIKYNKEVINLGLREAGELAQKGKKFEAISKDFEDIKQMAGEDGQSVPQFIAALKQYRSNKRIRELTEKCGGDEQLAQHIMELEGGTQAKDVLGFTELKAYFPQFGSAQELPQEVFENARLKGTLLLDEYLRYRFKERMQTEAAVKRQNSAEKNSIGSQLNRKTAINPEAAEFLKGLWR